MSLPDSNGQTLLITGINGYIASVLGALILSKGYFLRGTTRRAASAEPLLTGPYAAYKDRIKIFEVPDMTVDGAFDEAAKGWSAAHNLGLSLANICQESMASSTRRPQSTSRWISSMRRLSRQFEEARFSLSQLSKLILS